MQFRLYDHNRIKLRPLYPKQQAAIDAVRQAIREGHKRIVLQAPTGFGKTLTAAHIIGGALEKGRRPLFTCPAITLVEQTLKAFEGEGIHDIGIIQAQHERTDWSAPVQIASVQTLIRRALPEVDLILIDEVHEGFDGLNERLDSEEWKNKVAIGLSATPWAKGMGLRWTKLIVAATVQELIDEGYLSEFVVYVPPTDLDRSKLKIKQGEFTDKSSAAAMNDSVIIGDVVRTWKERGPGGKTFLFCVNRAHAQAQMAAFIDAGVPCGYIDANTSMDDRKREFARLRNGDIAIIASVGCLIRGVDEDVRCIIDCQPTRSEMRHMQKWGRGLRTAPGKDYLIGLDHAGNTLALGLVTDIHHDHLDARQPSEKGEAYEGEAKPKKPRKCPRCGIVVPFGKVICPACGESMPRPVTGVEHREGELVEFDSRKNKADRETKQRWYSELLGLAIERGYSEGWCAHRYREQFGVWPRGLDKVAATAGREVRKFDQERRAQFAKQRATA